MVWSLNHSLKPRTAEPALERTACNMSSEDIKIGDNQVMKKPNVGAMKKEKKQ